MAWVTCANFIFIYILIIYIIMLKFLYSKFGKDKVYHFSACFLICIVMCVMCMIISHDTTVSIFSGAMCASAAAVAKEYGDKFNINSGWSNEDLIADALGCLTAVILFLLFIFIF